MKITRMKLKNDDEWSLNELSHKLKFKLLAKGYITEVDLNNGKIGMHMRSFKIDTKKLGYNAKINYMASNPKAGYKRTDVPLWEQREEFNHIVNDFFDKHKITANIISGKYLIRDHATGRVNEWECVNYVGGHAEQNMYTNGYGEQLAVLMTEENAKKEVLYNNAGYNPENESEGDLL